MKQQQQLRRLDTSSSNMSSGALHERAALLHHIFHAISLFSSCCFHVVTGEGTESRSSQVFKEQRIGGLAGKQGRLPAKGHRGRRTDRSVSTEEARLVVEMNLFIVGVCILLLVGPELQPRAWSLYHTSMTPTLAAMARRKKRHTLSRWLLCCCSSSISVRRAGLRAVSKNSW